MRVVSAHAGDHPRPVADRLEDGAQKRLLSASVVVGDSPVVPLDHEAVVACSSTR
jgi:hypothetical protein